jgi:transcription initiation factor TFIID subunit 1
MDDSEDENNQESDGINLAGFLFGNINEKGELENDFLDSKAKKSLASLTKYR